MLKIGRNLNVGHDGRGAINEGSDGVTEAALTASLADAIGWPSWRRDNRPSAPRRIRDLSVTPHCGSLKFRAGSSSPKDRDALKALRTDPVLPPPP
jgi:hypothetical protein